LLGFLLIAADPFHIALSRVLHVDALASSLMLLALLAYLNYLHRGRRGRDLVVSGVAAGLAWLTKVPALFLVPFIGALTLRHLWSVRHGPRRVSLGEVGAAARPFVLWGAVGLLVFVIVWPAMWVDPVTILRTMARDALGLAKSGHQEAPLFFNGAIVRDPGWLFYPITYLWRTTLSCWPGWHWLRCRSACRGCGRPSGHTGSRRGCCCSSPCCSPS
nr:glycosyltransferase family 39 protein [Gemmatimonadales bacterium]